MTNAENRDTAQPGATAANVGTKPAGAAGKAVAGKAAPTGRRQLPSQRRTTGRTATRKAKAKGSAKTATTTAGKKPRPESKGARILEMIGRGKGATLAEITQATKWQAHSVRGFLSTAAKKHRLKIASARNEAGERTYKLDR